MGHPTCHLPIHPHLLFRKEIKHTPQRSKTEVSDRRLFLHAEECDTARSDSQVLILFSRRPSDTLPLLGNAIKFLQPRQVLFDWFVKCQQQFGLETFEISVPTLPPGVVINDPKNLEFVLRNEQTITKGEFFKRRSWDLFGETP